MNRPSRDRRTNQPERVVIRRTQAAETRLRLVAGAVCCTSGVALVVHILTGSPLWLALTGVGFAGSLAIAAAGSAAPQARRRLVALAKRGAVVGMFGTAAYDIARWLLVKVGALQLSPFDALPLFGRALLGAGSSGLATQMAGIGYHVLNGVAFGMAYIIWFGRRRWFWGIWFALGLEAFMLAMYPGWLDPVSMAEFTQVSLFGHLAYGTTLGVMARVLRDPDAELRGG